MRPARSASNAPDRPLLRRLWLGGMALLAVVLGTALPEVVRAVGNPQAPLSVGHDLLAFYTAGRLVRAGRYGDLYSPGPFQAAERQVMAEAGLAGDARGLPWVNPPFYAWPFAALSVLPYRAAAGVMLAISIGLTALSVWLMCRMLPASSGGRARGLVPLFVTCSLPFWQALSHLQNTPLSLAIVCAAVALLRAGRPGWAGAVAGLLLFKPQLAAVVGAVMVLTGGRRAALGFALLATGLLVLSEWTMPGSLAAFARDVPPTMRHLHEDYAFNWARELTLQGFWRLALQGGARGPTAPAVVALWATTWLALAAALSAAGWRVLRVPAARDRFIAAAVVGMPLLMPHFMDYDLLLLAVPAVLFAADVCRGGRQLDRLDRWTLAGWVALFAASYVNPFLGPSTRVNFVAAALVPLAGLSIARCLRRDGEPVTMPPDGVGGAFPAPAV